MVALNIDFGTVTPNLGGGVPVKPEGWYRGAVIEATATKTRDGDQTGNAMLVLTIGYEDGTKYVERLNLWHTGEDPKRIAKENLAAYLLAMGLSGQQLQISDTSQFLNLPFEHFLGTRESTTDQGKKIKQNMITAVRMPDGKVHGNVQPTPPAGATAVGATAPAGGFAAPAAPTQAAGPQAGAQPWGGGQAGAPGPAAPQPPAAPPAPAFGGQPAAPAFGGAPAAPAFGGAPAAPAFGGQPAAPAFPGAAPAAAPAAPAFPAAGAGPWGGPTG